MKTPLTSWFAGLATLFVLGGIVATPAAYAWSYWTISNSTTQPTPAMLADRLALAAYFRPARRFLAVS